MWRPLWDRGVRTADSWRCWRAAALRGGVVGRNGGVVVERRCDSFDGDGDLNLVAFALGLRFSVGEDATGGNAADFCSKH